jgi:hypothetical protein
MTAIPETGGYARFEDYQRAEAESQNRIGTMALQTIFDAVLGSLTYDHMAGTPAPRSGFWGRSFEPSITGSSLVCTFRPGLGMRYDSSETDEYVPHIKPFILDDADTITADAADGANDRIDIVCVSENDTDDQSASRYVKNPTTGAVSSQTVETRTSLGCTLNYVAGTPAGSPVAPSVPAGYIKICEFTVAAASSAISGLVDHRKQLSMPGQLPRTISHGAFHSEDGADIGDEERASVVSLGTAKAAASSHYFTASLDGFDALRLNSMTIYGNMGAVGDILQVQLFEVDVSTGTSTQVGSTAEITGLTGNQFYLVALDHTINETEYYYVLRLRIMNSGGGDAEFYCVTFE